MISFLQLYAALLLALAAGLACADDTHGAPDLAGPRAYEPTQPDSAHAGAGWEWRGLKAGLRRKLDGGWTLGLNYGRTGAVPGVQDRRDQPAPRLPERPGLPAAGHKALVLSMHHSF